MNRTQSLLDYEPHAYDWTYDDRTTKVELKLTEITQLHSLKLAENTKRAQGRQEMRLIGPTRDIKIRTNDHLEFKIWYQRLKRAI